ncbi:Ribokinase-like protein [Rhizopus microsporus var. microsporus]|uniref:pyridoxal kinase n=2 Tax=Rhizopus microsporus TaxID=58291 RepID=A0A2G4SWV2_RHIZD|nr:pyridoxal kinase [Rhizopus microsporus ATCC 52813]ORE05234.1 Ribokinase-like protein [Rhizopus microsporus var. microsporus]PHZ13250.1 pyridoxal kinase [Rhizopus microsporus ATCC 52813]
MSFTEYPFEPRKRVLSIQSHTVSGYCGNKAAVFPLQTLGYDVDILNTVQFSNHTGYPSWTGKKFTAEDVQELFDGLEKNELTDEYTHVLTGYIGNYAILEKIEFMVQKLKSKNPNLIYVCDTVMGDGGALYVAPEIVPLYRDILRIADFITPNQFEAELLSEMKIANLKDACQVAKKLHSLGPRNVIITTLSLPLKDVPEEVHLESSTDESLYCFTSQVTSDGDMEQYLISFPTYEGYFTGTGDLFSSLIVARCIENTLIDAAYKAVCSVNAITRNTFFYQQYYQEKWEKQVKPSKAKVVHKHELLLIQGKKFIEDPQLGSKDRIKFINVDQQ